MRYTVHKKIIDANEDSQSTPIKKLILFVIIIFLPVLLVMGLFYFFKSDKPPKLVLAHYIIEQPVTNDDLTIIITRMRADPEFVFYFKHLTEPVITGLMKEVLPVLKENTSKGSLGAEMRRLQKKAEANAALFLNLKYEKDFLENPNKYPEYLTIMWDFLESEFKVAVIGIIYKSNFSPHFVFEWNWDSVLAANKLRGIIDTVKANSVK